MTSISILPEGRISPNHRFFHQVHAQTPYNKPEQRTLSIQDGIFQFGGEQLSLQLSQTPEGSASRYALGLAWV